MPSGALKAIDWTTIYKKYRGQWVALKQDEITVLAAGKDASKVLEKARKLYKEPILTRVPERKTLYIGHAFSVQKN